MPSLSKCLETIAALDNVRWSAADTTRLMERAQDYSEAGKSPNDAYISALDDIIENNLNARKAAEAQLREQVPEVKAEAAVKAAEPAPEPAPAPRPEPVKEAEAESSGVNVRNQEKYDGFAPWVREAMEKAEAKGEPAILTRGFARDYTIYYKGNRTSFDGDGSESGSVLGEKSGSDVVGTATRYKEDSDIIAMTSAASKLFDAEQAKVKAQAKADAAEQFRRAEADRIDQENRATLEAQLQGEKFKKGEFTALDMNGKPLKSYPAWLHKHVAVYKGDSGEYIVGHPVTGAVIAGNFKSLSAAKLAAVRISKAADLSKLKSRSDVTKPEFKTLVEVVRSVKSGDPLKEPVSSGGTLYGGLPLNKMAEAVKKIFTRTWIDPAVKQAMDDAKAVSSYGAGQPITKRMKEAFLHLPRVMLASDIGNVEAIIRATGSKTIADKVLPIISEMTGTGKRGEFTWDSMTTRPYHAYMSEVGQALEAKSKSGLTLLEDRQAQLRIKNLVKNRHLINKNGDAEHQAAAVIAKLLDADVKKSQSLGVEVQALKNFFPDRQFNIAAVMADPTKFMDAVEKAFRKDGAADPKALAKALTDAVIAGEYDTGSNPFIQHHASVDAKFTKHRVFSEPASQLIRDAGFYLNDPVQSLSSYFWSSQRKQAFEHFFGGRTDGKPNARWREIEAGILAEGNGEALGRIKSILTGIVGEPFNDISQRGRTAISWLRTMQFASYLSGITTVLSSAVEPASISARTGNPADLPRAFGLAYRNFALDIEKRMERRLGVNWVNVKSYDEARRIVEMIGATAHAMLNDSLAAARFGTTSGEYSGKSQTPQLLISKMAAFSGLDPLTQGQRAAAAAIGQNHLRNLGEYFIKGEKSADMLLGELGIPSAERKQFSQWVTQTGKVSADKMATDTGRMMNLYKQAMYAFVTQSIMSPHKAQKPHFAKHPILGLPYDLLSWTFAYTQNAIKRGYRLAKVGADPRQDLSMSERGRLLWPAITTGAVIPLLQMAMLPVRDWITNMGDEEGIKKAEKRRETKNIGSVPGWFVEGASRGGAMGTADPLMNLIFNVRYERDLTSALAGPELGGLLGTAQSGAKVFLKNSANSQKTEEAFAKGLWNTIIEPSLVMGNSVIGGAGIPAPVASVAQHAIKSPGAEKMFVDQAAPVIADVADFFSAGKQKSGNSIPAPRY